jgi:histidyl-tRNA synthetase
VTALRAAGVQTSFKSKPKLLDQFQQCEMETIPLCVVIGPDELKRGVYKVAPGREPEEGNVCMCLDLLWWLPCPPRRLSLL